MTTLLDNQLVRIRITEFCPSRCIHCPDSRKYSINISELTSQQLASKLQTLSKIINFRTAQASLTGGEPLAHSDFKEMLNLGMAQSFSHLLLATEGSRLSQDISMIEGDEGQTPDEVLLSLEYSEQRHTQLRPDSLHFKEVCKLAEKLKLRFPDLIVSANTLLDQTTPDVERVLEAIRGLKNSAFDVVRLVRFREFQPQNSSVGLVQIRDEEWAKIGAFFRTESKFTRPLFFPFDRSLAGTHEISPLS